jgi:hypothetical protein
MTTQQRHPGNELPQSTHYLLQVLLAKAIGGFSPWHMKAALRILKAQLKCVWPVIAALRQLQHACPHSMDHPGHGKECLETAGVSIPETKQSAAGQILSVLVAGLQNKLPEASVLHLALQNVLPVLFGREFGSGSGSQQRIGSVAATHPTDNSQAVRMNVAGLQLEEGDEDEDSKLATSDDGSWTAAEARSLFLLLLEVR